MATDDATTDALGNPLDETTFNNPLGVASFQGVHDNTVLYYFATSPFFDRSSKNHQVFENAAANGPLECIATREAFEKYVTSYAGLEYVVAQEPAETGHGMGTGVWVIRKQERAVNSRTGEHTVRPLADYFLVGETVYQAPTFADVLTSRIATISNAISKIAPAAAKIQKWSPSTGHIYQTPSRPSTLSNPSNLRAQSKEPTPMPDTIGTPNARGSQRLPASQSSGSQPASTSTLPDARFAEESLLIHLRHGGEYMDENPITGTPGAFHLSSTGRRGERALAPPTLQIPGDSKGGPQPQVGGSAVSETAGPSPLSREGGKEKGRSGAPKPKRRKSKGGTTTPS